MKYLFVTLIFSFTFGLVSAQNNSPILPALQKYSNKVYVGNVSADNVQKYLQQHQPHLMQPNVSLQWQQTQQSPLGTHYTFVQQYKGMPIYGTSIKATINKSNYLVLIMDNTFDVAALKHPITPNNNRQANAIAQQFLQTKNEALDNAQTLVCFTSPSTIIEAIVLKAHSIGKADANEYILDTQGNLLQSRNLSHYYHQCRHINTTDAQARVFIPDPLTSAQKVYGEGGKYRDNNDADATELDQHQRGADVDLDAPAREQGRRAEKGVFEHREGHGKAGTGRAFTSPLRGCPAAERSPRVRTLRESVRFRARRSVCYPCARKAGALLTSRPN